MLAKIRSLRLSALSAAFLIAAALTPTTSWSADERSPEEIRQLILGHEAFIRQCIRRIRDQNMSPEVKAFLDNYDFKKHGSRSLEAAFDYLDAAEAKARKVCERMYEGVNVCEREAGRGALLAIERLTADLAEANGRLRDPLTRADEFEVTASAIESLNAELTALRTLAADRSDPCDTTVQAR